MSQRRMGFYFSTDAGSHLDLTRVRVELDEDLIAVMHIESAGAPPEPPQPPMFFDADDLEEFGLKCAQMAKSMRRAIDQAEIAEEEGRVEEEPE
jgi:hypothetical protein